MEQNLNMDEQESGIIKLFILACESDSGKKKKIQNCMKN